MDSEATCKKCLAKIPFGPGLSGLTLWVEHTDNCEAYICNYPNCGKQYKSQRARRRHYKRLHENQGIAPEMEAADLLMSISPAEYPSANAPEMNYINV